VTAHASADGFVTRHRFVLLFGMLLLFFVLVPIDHQLRQIYAPDSPPIVEECVFIGVLAMAVVSVSKDRPWKIFTLVLGLPAATLGIVKVLNIFQGLLIIRHLFAAAFLSYVISVMLVVIFTSRRVTADTVCASLCIYLLLGVVWAMGYSVIDILDPEAFRFTLTGPSPVIRMGSGASTAVLYFSFATLTTLGYGDIVPISPMARMLAVLEAITGQLFLAVLVARLVGMHIVHSMDQGQVGANPQEQEKTM
jgi:hypothetical protein